MLFLVHSIWNSCVSYKVRFFAWEASWGEVLTLDQLKRKERVIANRCFLCKEEEETVDHNSLLKGEAAVGPFFGPSWHQMGLSLIC